jgi:hypothetical protein
MVVNWGQHLDHISIKNGTFKDARSERERLRKAQDFRSAVAALQRPVTFSGYVAAQTGLTAQQ